MSSIQAKESLSGSISAEGTLSGKICEVGGLKGKLSVLKEYQMYDGEYEVIPKAGESQTLETENKVLRENLIVREVPFYETSNDSNGLTAYIAKEV